MLACALVCRSWLHRSQRLLFPFVELSNANQAKLFLAVITRTPSLGQRVKGLAIGPLKQDPDGTRKPPCFYNWIYTLPNTLPALLPNATSLTFRNLPTMHKSFLVTAPRFTAVTHLVLEGVVKQSFSEIIRLVNHFPHLEKLYLSKCQWRQPAHCYSGTQLRLRECRIWTVDQCGINGMKWLSASHSALMLTQLWIYDRVDSAAMMVLGQIMKQCISTLQALRLNFKMDTSLSK